MMGMNMLVRVWRITEPSDDAIGGALVSGTLLYTGKRARIESQKPDEQLVQQGFETEKIFNMNIQPVSLDIREHDEIEIISPTTHPYYNKRLQVQGVQNQSMSMSDPRSYLLLTLRYKEYAHA